MRRRQAVIAALAVAWIGQAAGALAQEATPPVVVELFTSQGCSSCPPADALLSELAPRDDVIALALHVDYWDYIGWKDTFADPQFTDRQKAYARAAGAKSIYTPQMIVEGKDAIVGMKPMRLADLIRDHRAEQHPVRLALVRNGDRVEIRAEADPALAVPAVVQLVRYLPESAVEIDRGENAGNRIVYANVVTDWRALGEWDGRGPLSIAVPAPGDEPVVVILQEPGPGPIIAAARLR